LEQKNPRNGHLPKKIAPKIEKKNWAFCNFFAKLPIFLIFFAGSDSAHQVYWTNIFLVGSGKKFRKKVKKKSIFVVLLRKVL
jgi:hypothetical protein